MTDGGNATHPGSGKSPEREDLEQYIKDFPEYLEEKFFGHGDVEYGDSWEDVDPEYLLRRAEEEFYEFRQAVEHDQDDIEALYELADLANFALMYTARKKREEQTDE